MKKRTLLRCLLFTVMYAVLFSIGFTCFLQLAGLFFSVSLDGQSALAQHARFALYCAAVGLLALALFICLVIWNMRFLRGKDHVKRIWCCEAAGALFLAFLLMRMWVSAG